MGFDSRQTQRRDFFLFATASRPALGPILGDRRFLTGVKRPGRESDQLPPSSAEVKNGWTYTSTPPVCLNGVVLS
jgi:hypothetical protein